MICLLDQDLARFVLHVHVHVCLIVRGQFLCEARYYVYKQINYDSSYTGSMFDYKIFISKIKIWQDFV